MPFIGRQTWTNDTPPARGYVYVLPGTPEISEEIVNRNLTALVGELDRQRQRGSFDDKTYVIATVGGDLGTMTSRGKIFTFFAYKRQYWDSSHDTSVRISQVTNGRVVETPPIIYEEVIDMIAIESANRYYASNVHDYMDNPPKMPSLELVVDKISDLPPA